MVRVTLIVRSSEQQAGGDAQWLKENASSFRKLADGGDEDFKDLVREMEEREDLKAALS